MFPKIAFPLLLTCLLPFSSYGLTCTWNGGTGNWSDPSKWGCGVVPDSDDDVIIQLGSTVTLDAPATVQSVDISGGSTLTLQFNLAITGNLILTGNNTTITGPGDLSVGGNMTWTRGIISGAGAITLTGTLTSNNGNCTLSRNALTLSSGGSFTNTLFTQNNGAILTIPAGQTLTVSNSSSLSGDANSSAIINQGILLTGGTGLVECRFNTFTNTGSIQVTGSNFRFGGGANSNTTHTGASLTIAAGKTLDFVSGTSHSLTNTSVTGSGTFKVAGNGVNVNINTGSAISTPVDVTLGTLTLNVPQIFPSLYVSGTISLSDNLTVTGNMNQPGGIVNGTGNLIVSGNLTLSGGADILGSGTLSLTGTVTASGGNTLGRSLSLTAGGTFTNLDLDLVNSAVLTIPAGQTLTYNMGGATKVWDGNGSGSFSNQGNFVKTGSGRLIMNLDYAASSGSATQIDLGILEFNNNFTNSGTVKGTGTIDVVNATIPASGYGIFSPGASPGTLNITGDYFNNTLNIEIAESGGIVTTDKLVVSGFVTLLNAGSILNVTESGNITSGSWVILTAGILADTFTSITLPSCYSIGYVGNSVVLYKDVPKVWDGSTNTWSSQGNWNPNGVPCNIDNVIIGSGVCTLDIQPQMDSLIISGTGDLLVGGPGIDHFFINAPVNIESGGDLIIDGSGDSLSINGNLSNGGNILVGLGGNDEYLAINGVFDNSGGTIKGYGTIDLENATVSSYGTFSPGNSAGRLKVRGSYCNERAEIEIGASGGMITRDVLEITGTATAEGVLDILYLGGTVLPGTRTIMECPTPGCMTGMFNTINYPPQCPPGGCNVIVTDQTVLLQNTQTIEYTGTCLWIGGTGNWSTQTNWSCNDVPNQNDTIVINGGQITLNGPVTVASIIATEGSINGTDTLTVNGSFTKNGMNGFAVNTPFLLPNGLVNVAEGVLDFNGPFTYGGTVQGNGTIDLTDATVTALPDGNFSPGASPGFLIVQGNYTNNILNIEIGESGGMLVQDLLGVNGNMNLTGSTLNLLPIGTVPTGIFQVMVGLNAGNTQFASFHAPYCGNCSLIYSGFEVSVINTQACVPNLVLENLALASGTYLSTGELTAGHASIPAGNTVITKSDTGVLIQQDFTVELGGVLEITIEGCQ